MESLQLVALLAGALVLILLFAGEELLARSSKWRRFKSSAWERLSGLFRR